MGIDGGLIGSVILSGLVIVFLILAILIGVVALTSKIVNGTAGKAGDGANAADKPVLSAVTQKPVLAPVVQAGIEEETVAVISAAVYSCMNQTYPGVSYAVKSVSRAKNERPAWGFAGMQQNTRPF